MYPAQRELTSQGEIASLMTDLIVAAFDVLANAMYRSDSAASMKILRSFLVNKLPVFLSSYAGMLFEPQSAELCISQALERLDPTAFPSVSQIGDLLGSSGTLSEAKQEFLFACALHSLLPEASIEILLGDVPMQSLPAGGRYVRDELVSQCTSHSSRIEELVAELDNLEGNSGEIAMAMLQVRPQWQLNRCSSVCSYPAICRRVPDTTRRNPAYFPSIVRGYERRWGNANASASLDHSDTLLK